jgi:hypothetical protein
MTQAAEASVSHRRDVVLKLSYARLVTLPLGQVVGEDATPGRIVAKMFAGDR